MNKYFVSINNADFEEISKEEFSFWEREKLTAKKTVIRTKIETLKGVLNGDQKSNNSAA